MRTTLDIEAAVLNQARKRAVHEGTTLTDIVERALRHFLSRRTERPAPLAERWVVVRGGQPADVDVADRNRLYDVLDDNGR